MNSNEELHFDEKMTVTIVKVLPPRGSGGKRCNRKQIVDWNTWKGVGF